MKGQGGKGAPAPHGAKAFKSYHTDIPTPAKLPPCCFVGSKKSPISDIIWAHQWQLTIDEKMKSWWVRSFLVIHTINYHRIWYQYISSLHGIHCCNWHNLRDINDENFGMPFWSFPEIRQHWQLWEMIGSLSRLWLTMHPCLIVTTA